MSEENTSQVMKRKKPLAKLVNLEPERDEIVKRIIEYMKLHSEEKYHEYDKKFYYKVDCECGNCYWTYDYTESNKTDEKFYDLWQYYIYPHICYEIRMKANETHINILRKIFGDKIVARLLKHWGEKNIMIGNMLKKYAENIEFALGKEGEQ